MAPEVCLFISATCFAIFGSIPVRDDTCEHFSMLGVFGGRLLLLSSDRVGGLV